MIITEQLATHSTTGSLPLAALAHGVQEMRRTRDSDLVLSYALPPVRSTTHVSTDSPGSVHSTIIVGVKVTPTVLSFNTRAEHSRCVLRNQTQTLALALLVHRVLGLCSLVIDLTAQAAFGGTVTAGPLEQHDHKY